MKHLAKGRSPGLCASFIWQNYESKITCQKSPSQALDTQWYFNFWHTHLPLRGQQRLGFCQVFTFKNAPFSRLIAKKIFSQHLLPFNSSELRRGLSGLNKNCQIKLVFLNQCFTQTTINKLHSKGLVTP